jgi:hypothetical protein
MNLEKLTVPIKDKTASSKITSRNSFVSNNTDNKAVDEINITPIASKATNQSGTDGPRKIR